MWKGEFYGIFNDMHIPHPKLLAIFYGLSIAWNRGYWMVECQSDSLNAVSLVKFEPPLIHLYSYVVCDIRELLNRRVDFDRTLRQGYVLCRFIR